MENIPSNTRPNQPELSQLKVDSLGVIRHPNDNSLHSNKIVNSDGRITMALTLENIQKIKKRYEDFSKKFNYAIDNATDFQELISTSELASIIEEQQDTLNSIADEVGTIDKNFETNKIQSLEALEKYLNCSNYFDICLKAQVALLELINKFISEDYKKLKISDQYLRLFITAKATLQDLIPTNIAWQKDLKNDLDRLSKKT